MIYKPGSFMIGEDSLMVFIDDRTILRFDNLPKAAIKGLLLSKVTYMETAKGEVTIAEVTPEEFSPPTP